MFSGGHMFIVLMVVLIIFGAGKLPRVMGDVGKGIRAMREGLKGEEDVVSPKVIEQKDKV